MISEFLREQKRYTQKELCDILQCGEEKIVPLIRKLREYGVLKIVKASSAQKDMSDLIDDELELVDIDEGENEHYYIITYVGIITIAGYVLKCYPKYILNEAKPINELRQILKVLEKYNSKEQIIHIFNSSGKSQTFNLLAILLYFLRDYYEHGVYVNTDEIIESNGSGEILWDRTINETFSFLSNNRPYYIDLQTKKRVEDDYDYFKRLHECIISKASNDLSDADILDLFEITEVHLSEEEIDAFGEKEYILYRIEKELRVQFNTRKQIMLKTMYAYISRLGHIDDSDGLSMFGTNSFHLLWEKVCADIMDNQLNRQLDTLQLPVKLHEKYNNKTKLIDIIEKPMWSAAERTSSDTMIPDIITIACENNENTFFIFDAKYYVVSIEQNQQPKSVPGIDSITKQYLYQLAYKEFINDHGFNSVVNCFLMPTEKDELIDKGEVKLNILSDLGLQNIQIRQMPAKQAYSHYLAGTKIGIGKLDL